MIHIARFELVRLLGSRRGWASLIAFVLVWAMLLYYVIFRASRLLAQDGGSGFAGALLQYLGMDQLTDWRVPELAVYWLLGLMLLPFFCITLTADQTASDRSRGTMRLLTLRATRLQIFFGRYLGQILLLLGFVGLSLLSTLPVTIYRDAGAVDDWLALALPVLLNLLIVLLPYVALMAVVSVLAKSARQATIYAIIIWIIAWFLLRYLLAYFPAATFLEWVMPGSQIKYLLRSVGWQAIQFVQIPLIQTVVLLIIGYLAMLRRDL